VRPRARELQRRVVAVVHHVWAHEHKLWDLAGGKVPLEVPERAKGPEACAVVGYAVVGDIRAEWPSPDMALALPSF
jgi:hypothetical protein